jgi:hypothetical protein
MSSSGTTTVGAEVDPHWSVFWLTRALDRHQGLGVSVNVIPAAEKHDGDVSQSARNGSHDRQGNEIFSLLDATRLLHRWNLPQAQANLWVFAGVGSYTATGSSPVASGRSSTSHHHRHGLSGIAHSGSDGSPSSFRIAARPGVQVDFETTRFRVEGRGMLYLAPGVQRPLFSATTGVALMGPKSEGVQPWLELQVRSMPGVSSELEVIPKLRLLHRRIVLEVGYSSKQSVVGGFTYTF